MEFWKKKGRKAFAKHLRNKKGKWTKRMANSKSRQEASKELVEQVRAPFEILKTSLVEVMQLKTSKEYLDRDFDSLIDGL